MGYEESAYTWIVYHIDKDGRYVVELNEKEPYSSFDMALCHMKKRLSGLKCPYFATVIDINTNSMNELDSVKIFNALDNVP